MSARNTIFMTLLLLLCAPHLTMAQAVIQDDGVSLSYGELEYIVNQWTPDMKKAAANDEGDRLELLNQILVIKKQAREADNMPPDSEGYWELSTQILGAKRKFVIEQYAKTLVAPDMTELAAEHYKTEKEKYALVPERRISSHILFSCPPGACSREETKIKAQKVLDELHAGADFVAMVKQYSDDAGTKAKDGKFDKWMKLGESGVAGPYSEGVFQIKQVGGYSDLVSSQFGIHIIRLDGIEEQHYLPYEEVKAKIMADLETEYKRLSLKEFNSKFNMTKDAVIDTTAVEKILSPYKEKAK